MNNAINAARLIHCTRPRAALYQRFRMVEGAPVVITRTKRRKFRVLFCYLRPERSGAMTELFGDSDTPVEDLRRIAAFYSRHTVTHVTVTLDPSDTYTVKFQKVARAPSYKVTDLAEVSFVYVDALHRTIEQHTGLYTKL